MGVPTPEHNKRAFLASVAATRGLGPFVIDPDGTVTPAAGVLDAQGNPAASPPPRPVLRRPAGKRPARNQPCPCGSGRKFKKCCGRPTPSKQTPPPRR